MCLSVLRKLWTWSLIHLDRLLKSSGVCVVWIKRSPILIGHADQSCFHILFKKGDLRRCIIVLSIWPQMDQWDHTESFRFLPLASDLIFSPDKLAIYFMIKHFYLGFIFFQYLVRESWPPSERKISSALLLVCFLEYPLLNPWLHVLCSLFSSISTRYFKRIQIILIMRREAELNT